MGYIYIIYSRANFFIFRKHFNMYKSFISSIALLSLLTTSSIVCAFEEGDLLPLETMAGSAPTTTQVPPSIISEDPDSFSLIALPISRSVVASAPIPSYPPISSVVSLIEFNQRLTQYVRGEDFDSLVGVLVGYPSLLMESPDTNTLNSYSSNRAYALRAMYDYLTNIQLKGESRTVYFCTLLIKHIKENLQKDSNSPFDEFVMLALAGKCFYKLSAYLHLPIFSNIPNRKEKSLRSALLNFENALKKVKDLTDIDRKCLESQVIETSIHSDAFNCSSMLSMIVEPSQQEDLLGTAARHRKKLEDTVLYKDTEQVWELTMLTLQKRRVESRMRNTNSSAAQAFYNEHLKTKSKEADSLLTSMYFRGETPPHWATQDLRLRPQLKELNEQLVRVTSSKPEGWSLHIKQYIIDTENTIKEALPETRRNNLQAIYGAYFAVLNFGLKEYSLQLLVEVAAFIDLNDLDEALKRIDIYKQFSLLTHDTLNSYYKGLEACIKNLQGDSKELQKWIKEREKKSKKKEQEKRKKQERKAALIKEDLAVKAADQKLRDEKQDLRDQKTKRTSSPTPQKIQDQSTTQDVIATGLSSQEEKAAKIKRHEEAKKQKAALQLQEEIKEESPPQLEVPYQDFSQALRFSAIPDLPTEIEGLKSLARKVDLQIVNGSWKCTREEIINYFRSFGCTLSMGKGSHEKLRLPPHVWHGETLVGIITELEDVLSLPKWTDTVPLYLRKQILSMREKAITLHTQGQPSVAE